MSVMGEILSVLGGLTRPFPGVAERPVTWATPIIIEGLLYGVNNLHRVDNGSGQGIWRSAAPSRGGILELREILGIKKIICLQAFPPYGDVSGVQVVHLPLSCWKIDADQLGRIMHELADSYNDTLVHCRHGADRTGLVCAMYRCAVQFPRWTPAEAAAEMILGGFGFHPIWMNLVKILTRDNQKVEREKT